MMEKKNKPYVFDFDVIDDTPPARFTETGDVIYNDPDFEVKKEDHENELNKNK